MPPHTSMQATHIPFILSVSSIWFDLAFLAMPVTSCVLNCGRVISLSVSRLSHLHACVPPSTYSPLSLSLYIHPNLRKSPVYYNPLHMSAMVSRCT